MRCFNCDYQRITKDMENCPVCGVGLSRTCKKCNSFNPSSAKFCFECGNELDNVKQDKLEKQQKVGVIFADISGFTKLGEAFAKKGRIGPEFLAFSLNRYMEQLINIIGRNEFMFMF